MTESLEIAKLETHDGLAYVVNKPPPDDRNDDGSQANELRVMAILFVDNVYEVYAFPNADTTFHRVNLAMHVTIQPMFVKKAIAFTTIQNLTNMLAETKADLNDPGYPDDSEDTEDPEEPAPNPFQAAAQRALATPPAPPNGTPSVGG